MANKVNTALEAIRTAIAAHGSGATFKKVEGKLVNPMQATVSLPYVSVKAGDASPVGGPHGTRQWTVLYVIQVITACKSASVELELIDLVAAIESVIDGLVGTAVGCVVNQPRWLIQEHLGQTTKAAWAMGTGELQITGPLLTS